MKYLLLPVAAAVSGCAVLPPPTSSPASPIPTPQAVLQPAQVVIQKDPGVSVTVQRNKNNENTSIVVKVNPQDSVTVTNIAPPPAWKQIAVEGESFFLPVYPQRVRYGANNTWVEIVVKAGGMCSNEFFGGDPVVGVVKRCEYWTGPPVVIPPIPPTDHGAGLPVDITGLTFQPGIDYQYLSEPRPQNPVAQPGDWEKGGDLRTLCNVTTVKPDDPIVNPGQPGAAHMHTFFGAVNINANTTVDNIRATGQKSSCRGGMINASGYWVPTMVNTATGKAIMPRSNLVYYKTGLWPYMNTGVMISPIAKGMRMVAGDAKATGPTNPGSYGCLMPALGYNRPVPAGKTDKQIPDWCQVGDDMWQVVPFPQCGMLGADGKPVLDSPDHKAHVAWPVFNDGPTWTPQRQYKCPDSHPVVYPQITYHIQYVVPANPAEMKNWKLSSDVYTLTNPTAPGGYSTHGDWMNGWDNVVSDLWGKQCSQVRRDCGSHEIGDGRVALEFQGN